MMHVQGLQGCMAMSATATAAAIAAAEGNRGHGLNTANVHVQTDTAATPAETRARTPRFRTYPCTYRRRTTGCTCIGR